MRSQYKEYKNFSSTITIDRQSLVEKTTTNVSTAIEMGNYVLTRQNFVNSGTDLNVVFNFIPAASGNAYPTVNLSDDGTTGNNNVGTARIRNIERHDDESMLGRLYFCFTANQHIKFPLCLPSNAD